MSVAYDRIIKNTRSVKWKKFTEHENFAADVIKYLCSYMFNELWTDVQCANMFMIRVCGLMHVNDVLCAWC